MPVIKNIMPISEILSETTLLAPSSISTNGKKLSKKEEFLLALEQSGINKDTVAQATANQFYSSDESIKDKAIERWLKLTEVLTPNDMRSIPTVNIIISGNGEAMNPILSPRDLTYETSFEQIP